MAKTLNLAFGGSGTNFYLYVGAYRAIYELLIATGKYELQELAGTSGGGLIASIIASGYTRPEEVEAIVMEALPAKYIDWSWLPFFHLGLIKGKRLRKKFASILVKRMRDTKVPLMLTATDLNHGKGVTFSTVNTPDAEMSLVTYATMCFPFVFAPVKIGKINCVDGGVTNNVPLDTFIKAADETYCFVSSGIEPKFEDIKGFRHYVFKLIDVMLKELTREKIEEVAEQTRIVKLSGPSNSMNLFIGNKEVKAMIDEGYAQTMEYLANQGF